MAFDPTPWFVKGGNHSAEIARMMGYAATNGATGVNGPLDLRALATSTPSNQIRIMPGGGCMASRYSGAVGQSYAIRNPTETLVTVTATGSSGSATKYLIVKINDPNYAGVGTGLPYIEPVWLTVDPRVTPPAYPFVEICKLVQPMNTATITQAMLTDRRRVANPREQQLVYPRPTVTSDPAAGMLLTASGADGEWFPNAGAEQLIDIPSWATRMQIEAEWLSVLYGPENAVGWGDMWVDYGAQLSAQKLEFSTSKFRWDAPRGDYNRANWKVAQDVAVPFKLRGKNAVQFLMKARRDATSGITCKMDHRSGIIFKVRFLEVADLSDS